MKFKYPPGATPLNGDELKDLIPTHITTQQQLNAFEQMNITLALPWVYKQKDILTIMFIKKLHNKMFNQTWKWAGKFRKTQKNLGIEAYRIEIELKYLCDDIIFQIQNQSFSKDEIAIRLHHRLVSVHPFPNGNGRHARLISDLLLRNLGAPPFSWGAKTFLSLELNITNELRRTYISALKKADQFEYETLLQFARS
ncbi:MAG: mobile mystery protein B [Proteobacteria bacterium]|nr:mobile mystery protein B [Pseudomonadota bacterium]